MDLDTFLQFLAPKTLKASLRDVGECQDAPDWKEARDAIMNHARTFLGDGDEFWEFMNYDPK